MINRYKNITLALIALLTIVLFACNNSSEKSTTSTNSGKPEFVLSKDFHDFGTVEYGEMLSYSFKYYNNGTSPLIINKVMNACGCTKAVYNEKPLMPGDSTFLEIIFDTKGWRGVQFKQISIFTNEREHATNIIVKAEINDITN
ncbi:MAG: DUF1573 domain-containing protein [Bacteroidales bacterium]|jgi:hypothetical protein|nr:DUF1573 domain-containing protein [Bacteroidales bacterium]